MAQSIFTSINASTTSGNQLATLLNNFRDAYVSGNSGTSRPSALVAGGTWVDTTNDPASWTLKMYNGTTDTSLFTIDLVNNIASITMNSALFTVYKSTDDAVGAVLKLFKKRPTGNQTLASDVIGEIDFTGNRDDNVEAIQARIKALSQNNVTSTSQGSVLVFEGSTLGSASMAEWMRLVDAKLGIGTTVPDETLHIKGTGIKAEHASDDAVGVKKVNKKKRITGVGQVQSADVIAQEEFRSADNTGADIEVARVEVTALETHTTTAQGASWKLKTKKTGSASLTTRIDVQSASVDIPDLTVGSVSNTEISYLDGVTSAIQTQLNAKESTANKGVANGYAGLDSGGKVPAAQLPSYVDDILEYADFASLPATGATGIIYVTLATNKIYRWSGSAYVEVEASVADTFITTNAFTLPNTKHFVANASTDSSTTGADASLGAFTAGLVRLTNASLSSLANIPAGADGQILIAVNRTGGTVTVKDSADAVGTAANRILTGTGTSATMANNASFFFVYDSTTARWQLVGGTGSGSGQGGINYITNYNAEAGTTGFNTYADAAGTNPVDGTGGSPNVTLTRTTSSPLRGTGSFLITKDAFNRQGNGVSYDLTIDSADTGKVLQGTFDYKIASGTYADDDITIWVYDVTNSTLIQPAPYKLKNTTINDKMFFEFQTTTSTSYRLIFHVASTSALAYTVMFDNLVVGPQGKMYGSPVGDSIDATAYLTPTNFGTISNYKATLKKIGDVAVFTGSFVCGTPASSTALLALSNLSIDTTKLNTRSNTQLLGKAHRLPTTSGGIETSSLGAVIFFDGSTTNQVFFTTNGSSNAYSKENAAVSLASGNGVSFKFEVPILGWSSSQLMSNDADTRVIALSAKNTTAQTTGTTMTGWTINQETHGAFNASTGVYTVPSAGWYDIIHNVCGAGGTSGYMRSIITANAVDYAGIYTTSTASFGSNGFNAITLYLLAGQTISVRTDGSATTGTPSYNNLSIKKVQGPAQVMTNETVSASYWLSANFAASTTTPINFDSKEWDSHGSLVTTSSTAWKFTAPVSGIYTIQLADVQLSSSTDYIKIYKNGSLYKTLGYVLSTSSISHVTPVKLLAGEYIDFRPTASVTFLGGTLSASGTPSLAITRTGNY